MSLIALQLMAIPFGFLMAFLMLKFNPWPMKTTNNDMTNGYRLRVCIVAIGILSAISWIFYVVIYTLFSY